MEVLGNFHKLKAPLWHLLPLSAAGQPSQSPRGAIEMNGRRVSTGLCGLALLLGSTARAEIPR